MRGILPGYLLKSVEWMESRLYLGATIDGGGEEGKDLHDRYLGTKNAVDGMTWLLVFWLRCELTTSRILAGCNNERYLGRYKDMNLGGDGLMGEVRCSFSCGSRYLTVEV